MARKKPDKGDKKKGKDKKEGPGSHLPILIDPDFPRAIDHPLRQHLFVLALQGLVSPVEASKILQVSLASVSYHMRVLHEQCDGLIELVKTVPRRGAVEHYYRATSKTVFPTKLWRGVKKEMLPIVAGSLARDLFDDLARAFDAGKLDGENDHVSRTVMVLDDEGEREANGVVERAGAELEDVQEAAMKRIAKSDLKNKLRGYTAGLFAFESAWEPPDLRPVAAARKDG